MHLRTSGWLWHIRDAAQLILDETEGETFDSYSHNRLLRPAVERNFEIIGESMRRIRDSDPDVLHRLTAPA